MAAPPPPPPRRSEERAALGPAARGLLQGGIAVTAGALVLLALDLGLGWRLPQPFRVALPFVLAAGLCLALTVGVGAFGSARRPERALPPEPPPPTPRDR